MTLDKQALPAYLQRKKQVDDPGMISHVEAIGDSLKNLVFLATGTERRWIVKQALSRVQIKERWWIDRKRIFAEKNCLEQLHQLLPPRLFPDVLLEDRTDFILITGAPPDNATLWDDELEGGRIDLQIASQCGKLLATVHSETFEKREIKTLFKDLKAFDQLRINPYYSHLIQAFPELKKVIAPHIRRLKEGQTLVLGDLRPRNIWLNNGQLYLVDFATAHCGCPSFDLAFYTTDMCLKAMNNSTQKAVYLEAINVFWGAYLDTADYPKAKEVAQLAVCDLGCLLLAATDGRQPVRFLDGHAATLSRRIAQSLLFTSLGPIQEITEFINRTLIDG